MRRGHPAAGHPWSIAEYGKWQHVGITVLGDGRSEIDALLARSAVTRQIGLVTPYLMAALAAVACTDLVTTVSAALARRFATTLDLLLQAPSFDEIRLQLTLVCSHVLAGDPLLAWFRGVVREVAKSMEASSSPPVTDRQRPGPGAQPQRVQGGALGSSYSGKPPSKANSVSFIRPFGCSRARIGSGRIDASPRRPIATAASTR